MISYYSARTAGMYTAKDSSGKVCGFVSQQSIEDRGETHLIISKAAETCRKDAERKGGNHAINI